MAQLQSSLEPEGQVDLVRIEAACDAASQAMDSAATPLETVEAVVGALHDVLNGAFVAALVLEHERLWLIGTRGHTMIPDGIGLDDGIVGRATRTATTQFVPDVATDAAYIAVAHGIVSELVIPIMTGGEVLGVLNIETTDRLPDRAPELFVPLASKLETAFEHVRRGRTIDLSALARLFVHVGSLREPRAIADVTARALTRIAPLETAQVLLRDDGQRLVETSSWSAPGDAPDPLGARTVAALRGRIEPTAVFELLDAGVMQMADLAGARVGTIAIVPLRANGEELGILIGQSRFRRTYDHPQAELAALLGAHTAASIDAALALSRERRSASTDVLTGLLNRRGFEDRLERELVLAQDARTPLSLLVLDCDDFKDVNDRAGHEFGDALLREVGLVLSHVSGARGCAARLGGDEFVVMLPGVDTEHVPAEAEATLHAVRDGLDRAGFPLRLSIGIATYPYDGGPASQLLRAADQALYAAKAAGKNRVVAFRDVVRGGSSATGRPAVTEQRRYGNHVLEDVLEAGTAIVREDTVEAVLDRLAKSVTFVVGATGCLVSRIEGPTLSDAVRHALRDVEFGAEVAYLIDDFPLTREVLESGRSRSISFLDDDLDRAEAFVLREVRMNCCLLVPLVVRDAPWGLVEIYDMRLRRFAREDEAVVEFLVAQAARRLEELGDNAPKRRLPLFRLPS